jgi:hypothetical protein
MKPRQLSAILVAFVFFCVPRASSDDQGSASLQHISSQGRMDVIRTFTTELVYIRSSFPMGSRGLTLKDGNVTPSGEELQRLMAMWGPSAKAGDQALITAVLIKNDRIHFEINGGPVHKKKWYQHIEAGVGGSGGTVPITPSDNSANARGSFVDLIFDHYVPEVSPQQLKDLLRPVFNFEAKSAEEAYLETIPAKAKDAIKNHQVLVGMNREMVIHARGRPPKKVREKDGETEYEEWIYGEPPQDVDFVRMVGDEVVRVETMKVTGERIVRAEKEVELEQKVAKKDEDSAGRPPGAPSLRRPGEDPDSSTPASASGPAPPPAHTSDPLPTGAPPQ